MDEAAFMIAKIMAPFMIILGIWFLGCKDFVAKLRTSADKNRGILYCGAVISLLVGLTIIGFYNEWSWDISLAVTLLGWVLSLRGIYMLFMPDTFLEHGKKGTTWMKICGAIPLIWGVILLLATFQE